MDPLKNLECILLQCSLSGHQDPSMGNKTLQVCNQTNTSGKSETDITTSNCWQYWNNKCLQVRANFNNFCNSKKNLLSQVSILTGQNIGKEVNLSLCNFTIHEHDCMLQRDKSKIYRWGFGCLFVDESKRDLSTWPASDFFGWSSCHSGRTLSENWPLLWALQVLNFITTIKHCTIHYFYIKKRMTRKTRNTW